MIKGMLLINLVERAQFGLLTLLFVSETGVSTAGKKVQYHIYIPSADGYTSHQVDEKKEASSFTAFFMFPAITLQTICGLIVFGLQLIPQSVPFIRGYGTMLIF